MSLQRAQIFRRSGIVDRDLFDHLPEPAWVVRVEDLQVVDVNDLAVSCFGYSREQYLAMKLSDFHTDGDIERLRRTLIARDVHSSDLRGWKTRTVDGRVMDTDLSVAFIGKAGSELAIICTQDMAARKALEEQLRQAGKMEAIGMLAGGIAHDFNNLLTIISGYAQLLTGSVTNDERASVDQIMKASERAAELTGQLLAFSRRKEMQPQPLDINRVVSGMSTMLRRLIGEHIDLRLALAPDLGAVFADPSQIDQVIMNLVVNARDAMANGGTLVIETNNANLNGDYSTKHLGVKPGKYIMLSVTDTGVGMDRKTADRVFDPFFTTKEKGRGTGLGLSTVYGIVKQAGGDVSLYSEPARGTSVKVYLPRISQPVGETASETTRAEAVGGRETILVVEDEEAVRRLVRATLERGGYRVLVASGGPEALEISRSFEETIHLVLTDLVMPQMSGAEVAERLKKERPGVQVLFMSGYTDRSLQKTEILPDDTEFIQKPFSPKTLAERVRKVLDQNHQSNHHSMNH